VYTYIYIYIYVYIIYETFQAESAVGLFISWIGIYIYIYIYTRKYTSIYIFKYVYVHIFFSVFSLAIASVDITDPIYIYIQHAFKYQSVGDIKK
jgi:hypothetical protein